MANRINDTSSLTIGTRVTIGDPDDYDVSSHSTVIVLSVYDNTNFFAIDNAGEVMQYGADSVSNVMDTIVITPYLTAITSLV